MFNDTFVNISFSVSINIAVKFGCLIHPALVNLVHEKFLFMVI